MASLASHTRCDASRIGRDFGVFADFTHSCGVFTGRCEATIIGVAPGLRLERWHAWERLAQDAPIEPPGAQEVDFDVFRDLPRIDELIGSRRVDAVRIWYDGEPVGRIPPSAGAEPLTGEHVRNILVQRFRGVLLSVLTRQQGITATMLNGSPDRRRSPAGIDITDTMNKTGRIGDHSPSRATLGHGRHPR